MPSFSVRRASRRWRLSHSAALCLAAAGIAHGAAHADTGKLLLTGGITSVDGAGGGGITPWAVMGTNATDGEIGVSASASHLGTRDFGLNTVGMVLNLKNSMELSFARQDLSAPAATGLNALGFQVADGPHLKMDVVGVKVRVLGDAILDSDTWVPQVSVGLQHKRLNAGTIQPVLDFVGAKSSGTDVYVSASKLLLAQGILLNGTLRYTNANQGGLLGFGAAAPGRSSRSLQPEFSVAYLLNRQWAVGAEWRFMPNNLEATGRSAGLGSGLRQDPWKDLFVAWAPNRNVTLAAAWVDLGRVVPGVTNDRRQRGLYLSGQLNY